MSTETILKSTALFSKLNEVQFSELIAHLKEENLAAGVTFIHEGDKADALYVIKQGDIQVFTKDQNNRLIVLARLGNGAFFGEQALLSSAGTRTASVRTLTECILLKVDHKLFQQILESDDVLKKELRKIGFKQLLEKLKALETEQDIVKFLLENESLFEAADPTTVVETLHRVYQSPVRGEVTQYFGQFLHMPAVISKFKIKEGQEIISSIVIGKNIQSISVVKSLNPQSYIYEGKTIYRELQIAEGQLVGITAYGEWSAIKELYARLFEKEGITEDELKHFTERGEIKLPEVKQVSTESADEVICNCVYVTRGVISDCIKSGRMSIPELQEELAVGTVCGSCLPTIQMMLGHESWQAMHILNVSNLTSDIRAYRLIPVRNKPLRPFLAGQHVVIQCEIEGNWIERSYTLTSASGNFEYYEIAVKREDKGLLSQWLFKNDQSVPFIRVSHPAGSFTFDPTKPNALVCFTAGIGITPAVCFARTIEQFKTLRPLSIYLTAHSQKHIAYDSELELLAGHHAHIKYFKHLTETKGRYQAEDIVNIAQQDPTADFFICGPKGFESMVKSALLGVGIKEKQIIVEQFTHAFQL